MIYLTETNSYTNFLAVLSRLIDTAKVRQSIIVGKLLLRLLLREFVLMKEIVRPVFKLSLTILFN